MSCPTGSRTGGGISSWSPWMSCHPHIRFRCRDGWSKGQSFCSGKYSQSMLNLLFKNLTTMKMLAASHGLAWWLGLGRSDFSWNFFPLGSVLAFESVANWCFLYIKPFCWLIPKRKKTISWVQCVGFQTFSASITQTMSGPTSKVQGYDYLLLEVGNVQVTGSK